MKYPQHLTDICWKCTTLYWYWMYPPKTWIFNLPHQQVLSRGCSCSKKVQEPLGVEVCQTECISFFPVTIFKNLQPSDFFTLRLNTPTWSYRKKKACNRWINGDHCSHGYLPREHSCHFFMHLQTKSPDWIHHGGNANYNRLKESLVPWKVFSGTTSCGNAARASLSAERTRDATVLSGG